MHGKFYVGDSYLVLKTAKRPQSSALTWDLFYWLGSESEVAEQGIAAYKAVELDESLGGSPVQHREEQGHESEQFMQCFGSAVQYLKGGVASGFTHVVRDAYEPRLLHLKGTRTVRVTVVPLSASSLNAGDVFVLDLGLEMILQWNGAEANQKEKAKAREVCAAIRSDERGGKPKFSVCDQGDEPDEFWAAMAGGKGPVAAAIPDTSSTAPGAGSSELRLVKVSDASGRLEQKEVARGTLERSLLDSKDVFVMDNGAEIYVWVGKGATVDERKSGMGLGQQYCVQAGRPKGTRVVKVPEGAEPATFKANFKTWEALKPPPSSSSSTSSANGKVPSFLASRGMASSGNVAASTPQKSADELVSAVVEAANKRAAHRSKSRDSLPPTAVPGNLIVWRVQGFDLRELEASQHGRFHKGDSYIVKHTTRPDGATKEQITLYMWLGSLSTADEKGAAAVHMTRMDDDVGGRATQVRVEMGREPLTFIGLFEGGMVVHAGGAASGFKNRRDVDSYDVDGVELYHVRGTDAHDTRAVQVEEVASSLNSGDCFVLLTPPILYVWQGSGANEAERQAAAKVADRLKGAGRVVRAVPEGSEPAAFWKALGGKGEYPQAKVLPEVARDPMLYSCSNETGSLQLEPVFDFSQADLNESDIYILDVYTTIFVWVGSESNETERRAAPKLATAYLAKREYDARTPIVTVKSGDEPSLFTCNFLGWDATRTTAFVDPYEEKLKAAAKTRINRPAGAPANEPADADFVDPYDQKLKAASATRINKPANEPVDPPFVDPYELKLKVASTSRINKPAEEPVDDPFEDPYEAKLKAVAATRINKPANEPASNAHFEDPYEAKLKAVAATRFNRPAPEPEDAPFEDPYEAKLQKMAAADVAFQSTKKFQSMATPPLTTCDDGSMRIWSVSQSSATPPAQSPLPPHVPIPTYLPTNGEYTFPYEVLQGPVAQLPPGVDPDRREQYLSDADFARVLGSPRTVFYGLAAWKQKTLLKTAGFPASSVSPVKRTSSWSRALRPMSVARSSEGRERPPMLNFFSWVSSFGQPQGQAASQPTYTTPQQAGDVVQQI